MSEQVKRPVRFLVRAKAPEGLGLMARVAVRPLGGAVPQHWCG